MTRLYTPTPEAESKFQAGLAQAPAKLKRLAKKFDPWCIYWLKEPGQNVIIQRIYLDDDDRPKFTVAVLKKYNPQIGIERNVFGIDPKDLELLDPTPFQKE